MGRGSAHPDQLTGIPPQTEGLVERARLDDGVEGVGGCFPPLGRQEWQLSRPKVLKPSLRAVCYCYTCYSCYS
jgi:hypothetical protein